MPLSTGSRIAAPGCGIENLIGRIPHRLALAGGWIDQPFVSIHNPSPPGSMVVVALEPDRWFMERAGMASGTRRVALALQASSGLLPTFNRTRKLPAVAVPPGRPWSPTRHRFRQAQSRRWAHPRGCTEAGCGSPLQRSLSWCWLVTLLCVKFGIETHLPHGGS